MHKHGPSDKAVGYAVIQGIGHGIFVCVLFETLLRQYPQRIRHDQWIVRNVMDCELYALWIGSVYDRNIADSSSGGCIQAYSGPWVRECEA